MKKFFTFGLILLLVGCEKGPSGPTGPQGPPGAGIPGYTVNFEYGVWPDTGYLGSDPHWLDGSSPNNAPGTGEIRVATGVSSANVAFGLIRFDLSYGVPANATITGASLQLTTLTSSNLTAGTFVLGVHEMIQPPVGTAPWNDGSTYSVIYPPIGWNGGSSSPITATADYNASPMSAVTVTASQINGNQVLLAWTITPSVAQVWATSTNTNYGVLISTEPTTGVGSGFISFWDNTGNIQQKPKMQVEYTLP